MSTTCNRWFLLQILLLVQHVLGTTMPIIRSSRVLYRRLLPVVFGALVFKLLVSGLLAAAAARKPDTQPSAPHHTDNLKTKAPYTTGSNHLYNTLELLMMGIVVPETCWTSNKIWNKNHLLHLVVILFPQYIVLCISSHSAANFRTVSTVSPAETHTLYYYVANTWLQNGMKTVQFINP